MRKARVNFHKIIVDSQEYGSDDEYMVSRVFLDLEIGGQKHPNLDADIKQTVGGSFDTTPIEVESPPGYKGPFNYMAFREAVEGYYRSLVGEKGSLFLLKGKGTRMYGVELVKVHSLEFEVGGGDAGW